MMAKSLLFRWSMPVWLALGSVSCMTTYDRYGQPVQSVDPAVAIAGAAAAGLVAYSVANRNNNRHHHGHSYHGHGYGGYGHGGYGHCGTYRPRHGWGY